MKKTILIVAVSLVTLLTLGIASLAYAQTQNPPTPATPYGAGMMNGRGARGGGMMGGRWSANNSTTGTVGGFRGMMGGFGSTQSYMIDSLAKELGLTSADLQKRYDAGETTYQILQSLGKTDAEISSLIENAHDEALKAAVSAGAITQAQADLMDQHHTQMWQDGSIPFGMGIRGGRGGAGWWQNSAVPTTTPTN
jgi:hypothetical protein